MELPLLGGVALRARSRWIAEGVTTPWAAPHSWLAGTLPGLPVRCCMMIGVNSW